MGEALYLGPATERLFDDAFADGATITATAAADLLGLDAKTLAALSDSNVIRWVPRGKRRAYTERDLRAYLTEEHKASCPPPAPKKAATRSAKVVSFSDMKGKRDAAGPGRHLSARPRGRAR
jgi:hypothetical protein